MVVIIIIIIMNVSAQRHKVVSSEALQPGNVLLRREKAREKRNDVTNVHVNSSNRQCVQHNDEKEHGNK